MRVLHVTSGNLLGGVEKVILSLVNQPSDNTSHTIALCYKGEFGNWLSDAGARLSYLSPMRIRKPWTVLEAQKKLERLLETQEFNLVVFYGCWALGLLGNVVKRKKLPILFWVHDTLASKGIVDLLARRVKPNNILAVSDHVLASARGFFPGVYGKVILNPIDLVDNSLEKYKSARERIRRKYQTPDDTVVLTQVSRLEAWKGHENLFHAIAKLSTGKKWECWIVGGAQRPEEKRYLYRLKRLAKRLGVEEQVRFLGQASNVPELLLASDIFCQLNAHPEPFGIVFFEAMQAQLPIVTFAFGGPKEFLNEKVSLLIPPGNISEAALAMNNLIDDESLRSVLGKNGPSLAHRLCDPVVQARKINNFFSQCVTAKKVALEPSGS